MRLVKLSAGVNRIGQGCLQEWVGSFKLFAGARELANFSAEMGANGKKNPSETNRCGINKQFCSDLAFKNMRSIAV